MSAFFERFSQQITGPRTRFASDKFYLPSSAELGLGDILPDDPDYIYIAWPTMESAILAQGFGKCIYVVEGTVSPGVWGGEFGFPLRHDFYHPNGGVAKFTGTDDFYNVAKSFEDLRVSDKITDLAFGPNGKQVIGALERLRSKFTTDDNNFIIPKTQFAFAIKKSDAYYSKRVRKRNWHRSSMVFDSGPSFYRAKPDDGLVETSLRFWLNPWRLTAAWNRAISAASSSKRLSQCDWLGLGSAGLAALAIRDVISEDDFEVLYEGFSKILPLQELDNAIPPVLHTDTYNGATWVYETTVREGESQPGRLLKRERELRSDAVPHSIIAFRVALEESVMSPGRSSDLSSNKLTQQLSSADRSSEAELARAYHCTNWACRILLPRYLRNIGDLGAAQALESLAPISSAATVEEALFLIEVIEEEIKSGAYEYDAFLAAMAVNDAGGTGTTALLANAYADPVSFAASQGETDALDAANIVARVGWVPS